MKEVELPFSGLYCTLRVHKQAVCVFAIMIAYVEIRMYVGGGMACVVICGVCVALVSIIEA